MEIRLSEIVTPHFQTFWKASNSKKYLRHIEKGGRGSGKSAHIAFKLIKDMMKYPVTTLCVRKVANTLGESCFEQLKEAIDILGVSAYWRVLKSPMQLIYKPRGNKIIFRGADDPAKIKSIKMSKFPLAFLWIEELAEFKTEDEVSMIENSVLRAELPPGLHYAFYYSYNPPKRKQSWVNKKYESPFIPANTFVHHSTYLQNPHISKAFREEAEAVRTRGPINEKTGNSFRYDWEYGGLPIGSGVVPFDNLTFREITDEEMASFDNIRQGNDWGYGVDPVAFVRWHYDKTRRRIYAMDEIYGVKIANRVLAERMKAKGYHTLMTTADSAEPKSVDEMRDHGVRMRGAKKGPGSVEYGEKWLGEEIEEIIIDPKRTPNIAREFQNIDYKTDADGNPRAELDDKDNHTIDATRYAFEGDMKKAGISFD